MFSTAGLHRLATLWPNTQAQHVGWASFLLLSSPLPVTCHPGISTSQLCKACLSHQLSGLIRLPSLQPDTLASDKAISVFVGGLCLGARPPPSFGLWRCDKTGRHVDLNQCLCIFLINLCWQLAGQSLRCSYQWVKTQVHWSKVNEAQ